MKLINYLHIYLQFQVKTRASATSCTDFHQHRNQPLSWPTNFDTVPNFRLRTVQSTTSLFPYRFSPNSTSTLPFANGLKNVPDSGSGMSNVQLPYSPNDYYQTPPQPYHIISI